MIKSILCLAAIGLVLAGCGGGHNEAKPKQAVPSRVTQVTWYLRGNLHILEEQGYFPKLTKLLCRAAKHDNVTCFVQFADNECGRFLVHVDPKLKLVLGILHKRSKLCAPIVSPPA